MAAIRSDVLRMTPYAPGKPVEEVRRELGLERVVKLASNENPFGPSPMAVEAVREAAARMHIYPDGAAYDLKSALARHHDMEPGTIMVGNGSDELIHLVGLLLLEPGTELIMADPGFSRYDPSAHIAGARLTKVPVDADFRHDLPAMRAAVGPETRIVFVANPNNPTGTAVTKTELDAFLDGLPEHVTVVIDEAYIEFSGHAPDLADGREYVRQGRNVVVLRTFSKAYGLAGLRIGYGFAPADIVDAYHRAREPFNTNSLAHAGAVAALGDTAHVTRTIENNRLGLDRLATLFRELGGCPVESYANFAYADLGRDATPIFEGVLRRGVITRAGRHVGHPRCLRVSVGTPEELDVFETALRAELAS